MDILQYDLSNNKRYSNWFVLQVMAAKENMWKERIKHYSGVKDVEVIVFSKEIVRIRKGKKKRIVHPLFPGYIFVKNHVQTVINNLKAKFKNDFLQPLCFCSKKCPSCFNESSPCNVKKDEMKLLLDNSDKNGVFQASFGYREGNDVVIKQGALKNIQGNILTIKEKKGVAIVEIELFKRVIRTSLCLQVVKKSELAAMN